MNSWVEALFPGCVLMTVVQGIGDGPPVSKQVNAGSSVGDTVKTCSCIPRVTSRTCLPEVGSVGRKLPWSLHT